MSKPVSTWGRKLSMLDRVHGGLSPFPVQIHHGAVPVGSVRDSVLGSLSGMEGLDGALVDDLPAPTPQPIDELRIGPAYSSPTRGHSKARLLGRGSRLYDRQVCSLRRQTRR